MPRFVYLYSYTLFNVINLFLAQAIIQSLFVSGNLDSIKLANTPVTLCSIFSRFFFYLHADTKHGVLLSVVFLAIDADQGSKVVFVDSLFVLVHKVSPLLLGGRSLKVLLVQMLDIDLGEGLFKVLEDLVVNAKQPCVNVTVLWLRVGGGHLLCQTKLSGIDSRN